MPNLILLLRAFTGRSDFPLVCFVLVTDEPRGADATAYLPRVGLTATPHT